MYLTRLKNEQTKEYDELQGYVHKIYSGYKKDRDKNIYDTILFLWRKKRISLSKDDVVKLEKKLNHKRYLDFKKKEDKK